MLGNYLQQTTSADDIFKCIFFLGTLKVNISILALADLLNAITVSTCTSCFLQKCTITCYASKYKLFLFLILVNQVMLITRVLDLKSRGR